MIIVVSVVIRPADETADATMDRLRYCPGVLSAGGYLNMKGRAPLSTWQINCQLKSESPSWHVPSSVHTVLYPGLCPRILNMCNISDTPGPERRVILLCRTDCDQRENMPSTCWSQRHAFLLTAWRICWLYYHEVVSFNLSLRVHFE
jgi:hypothetical protein